jgi:hypothetical protein
MENPTKYSDTIIHSGALRLLGSHLGTIDKRPRGSGFSEILIDLGECVNVLTVEAVERLLFEEIIAAVIKIHNPSAFEDINQALFVLAENQGREHIEDILPTDSVYKLYKGHQEFKEDVKKCHLVTLANFEWNYC